ncbi:auxin-induced protein 5NG4-like protein [Corchorus olitorius]|uniref:Auxin-induced protein 5NG4-like protein n=1 Tax=Corchorus olitorius TaxID=93759 RepID=A0A1R3GR95_9ROSI|nr:auxin-induced protein 5NG4-like protein [Corchorus olitorius]
MACTLKAIFERYKPHVSLVIAHTCAAIVYFFIEAAFEQGLNPHIYVTYRFILGGFFLIPFAYFIERMEIVDVKSPRGIAKILGTIISLAGVMVITLCKGPGLQSSILGGVTVIIGLYVVLWGKERDQILSCTNTKVPPSSPSDDEIKAADNLAQEVA